MRASVLFILLGGCVCLVLANTRDSPEEELTTATARRAFQRRKHVDLKASNGTARRRRKKLRRPQQQVLISSVESDNSTADVGNETEYNQRVRSFASAIKDTDTFLRFLKLEESRHMRDYVRGRDFNFNNRSLTTRFLQNPMLRINDRSRRPSDGSSFSQEERRHSEETRRPTGRQFDPTQQFNKDVGTKLEKGVSRPSHRPTSRERKRSRTARRRFESVPKFSNEVQQSVGERSRQTTRQFPYTTQPDQDNNEDTISETSTARMEIVPSSRSDIDQSRDDIRKPINTTLSSTAQPTQDFEQRFTKASNNETSTEKAEADSTLSYEEQYKEQSRRPTTQTLTTIPQIKVDDERRSRSDTKSSKTSPDKSEATSNLSNQERQSTVESRRPTSRTFGSTSQPIGDVESRLSNENKRSRTRPSGSHNIDQSPVVETKRKTSKHFESSPQPNYDIRPRLDNEVPRPLPSPTPGRDKPRSRSSSERSDDVNTNYDTRQFQATQKSNQDPESRYENELIRTRTSDSFDIVRTKNNNEQKPIFVTRKTTAKRVEATTRPARFTESRSAKEIKHSRTSHETFEKVPKPKDRQQSSYETSRHYELTTQSSYYAESGFENEVQRSRTSTERFENVPVVNPNEQQSAFETRRATATQLDTATQTNYDHQSSLESEGQRSKSTERFEHGSTSNHEERIFLDESRRTTTRHVVPTSQPNENSGSSFDHDEKEANRFRHSTRAKISLDRFEIVPIGPDDRQSTFENRRSSVGVFDSKPHQDFDTRFYDEVTQPSIRFVPPEYSEKLYSDHRSDDESTRDSRYYKTSTQRTYRYLNDDYDEIKVPNRGLQPPIEPIPDDYDYYPTTTQRGRFSANNTATTERRPTKKTARKPKSRNPDRYNKHPDDDYDELRLTVAESTYYKKRKLTRLPMIDTYDSQQVIPGVAGRDYSVFSAPPDSEFACAKGHMGYFADVAAGCQVFYICTGDGRGEPMLCPNGTLFNQNVLVCDWWFNVVCNNK